MTFVVVIVILYFIAFAYAKGFESTKKFEKNILFVLAHPDDECMFFTPTIRALKEKSNLYILVLCNGGYDGLGKERTVEMARAARAQGFRGHKVIDDEKCKDGPWIWPAEVVQKHIEDHIKERRA